MQFYDNKLLKVSFEICAVWIVMLTTPVYLSLDVLACAIERTCSVYIDLLDRIQESTKRKMVIKHFIMST